MLDHESRRSGESAVPALQSRSMCNVSPDGHAQDTSMRTGEPLEGLQGVLIVNAKR